jgi:hypothetical protein
MQGHTHGQSPDLHDHKITKINRHKIQDFFLLLENQSLTSIRESSMEKLQGHEWVVCVGELIEEDSRLSHNSSLFSRNAAKQSKPEAQVYSINVPGNLK